MINLRADGLKNTSESMSCPKKKRVHHTYALVPKSSISMNDVRGGEQAVPYLV